MIRNFWIRFVAIALATALIGATVAACGGDDDDESAADEPRTVAVNMYTADNPYFQAMMEGIERKADEFGWQIEATFGDSDPTQQVNQLETAIAAQPDALIVVPMDEEAIVPPIREASEQGVAAFTMGDNIAEEGQDAQVAYVGADYEHTGEMKAEFISEQLDDEGQVGYIYGIRGLNFTEDGARGAHSVFEQHEGIEVIDGPYTGAFASDLGLDATQDLLTRAPNLDAIYFDNDSIAIGGIQALQERDIPLDDVVTVGTDGTSAAIEAVQAGELDYTIHLCGINQGLEAMDIIREYLNEEVEPEPFVETRSLELTPDNIDDHIDEIEGGDC